MWRIRSHRRAYASRAHCATPTVSRSMVPKRFTLWFATESPVVAPLAGEHELLLLLDGTEVDVRTIVAQCPSPLVSLPDRTCGCGEDVEPGSRLYHSDEVDTVHCQPCRFGHRKPFPGNEACSLAAWLIIVVASSASPSF